MPRIYFISDMHLGATYFPDPLEWEKRVVRFLDSIAGDADELYMLGDVLDYWYEYRNVAPVVLSGFSAHLPGWPTAE